jgi:hypothetical protein
MAERAKTGKLQNRPLNKDRGAPAMADEEQYSLSDDEIKSDYRTNPEPLREAFRHVGEIEERIRDAGDGDSIEVPVEALRRISMGMRIMAKSQSELSVVGQAGGDHGDRGANCDYNPFNVVNTGDFANIFG